MDEVGRTRGLITYFNDEGAYAGVSSAELMPHRGVSAGLLLPAMHELGRLAGTAAAGTAMRGATSAEVVVTGARGLLGADILIRVCFQNPRVARTALDTLAAPNWKGRLARLLYRLAERLEA